MTATWRMSARAIAAQTTALKLQPNDIELLIDRSIADPEVHAIALTSEEEGVAMLAGALFLVVLGLNFVVLAFDFARTTSLTLFFFFAAIVLALVLLPLLDGAGMHPDRLGNGMFTPAFFDQ